MDWKSIVGPAIQSAAPKLAKALIGQIPVIGPLATSFGGEAIDAAIGGMLAQVFGVEPTPEAVNEAIQTLPTDVVTNKLQQAQAMAEAKWPALAAIAVAEEETARTQIEATKTLMQAEIVSAQTLPEGKLKTLDIVLNSFWRPLFALEFLFECAFFFFGVTTVLLVALFRNDAFDIDAMVRLMPLGIGLLLPYLAMRCGLIGYHMNLRTRDKEAITEAVTTEKPVSMVEILALLRASGVKVK